MVTAITAVIVWILRRPLETDIIDEIKNPSGRQATQIVIDVALWRNLGPLIWSLVIVAVLAALIAWLAGPSTSAVAVRRTVTGLFRSDDPQTTASEFLRRHAVAFRIAGAIVAIVALFTIPDLTWGWFLSIVVVLAAYELSWIYVAPADESAQNI
jgi:hypothetical protein